MKTSDKICDLGQLQPLVTRWKEEGKIVFTNGCFDILHLGHVDYLEQAAAKGSRLIVGLNTDSSVKRLKGPERPVNNEYARARVLAALQFVDAVVLFEEDTPVNLIEAVCPDVLIKGNDYTIENIIGAEFVIANGGSVETIPLVPGVSTTNILSTIKKNK